MSLSIVTERFDIRPLDPRDAEAVFSYRSRPLVTRFQGWEPASASEVRTFIEGMAVDAPGRWFQLGLFVRDTGELAGDLGIRPQADDPRQVEVGITLAPEHQGHGLATEALRAVIGYLFVELGKHRVLVSVDPRNTPSMALFERIGMRREACFRESLWFKGAWADDVIFATLRREWDGRCQVHP